MSKRIKAGVAWIQTREQMETEMGKVRDLVIGRNELLLEKERKIAAIDQEYGPMLEMAEAALKVKTDQLRMWAEGNQPEFGGKKSLETAHGVLGWRLGNPTLACLSGWTWEKVLERLKELPALWHYIRKVEEVDKAGIKAGAEGMGPDMLRSIGVRITQSEPFFVEPKLEEPENRQTAAA